MLLRKRISRTRVLATAIVLAMVGTLPVEVTSAEAPRPPQQAAQQQTTQQTGGTTQQKSSVPDAPKPQTLPDLKTLTPVAPAASTLPSAPAPAPDANEVPNALPAAPMPQSADDADHPDVPAAGQGPAAAFNLGTIRVNFVEVPFTVKDSKGQLVPGLQPRDVRVYENGLRQQLRLFTTDPFPLSVALIIDQSVPFDVMQKVNNALGALQGAFTKYDEIAVFTYNNGVKLQDGAGFDAAQSDRLAAILERSKGPGREPPTIAGGPLDYGPERNGQQIPTAENGGRTGPTIDVTPPKEFHTLLDAIFEAAQQTTKAGPGRRRIVYVISDGKEYGSKVTEKQLIRYCQTNKIAVYATLIGDSSIPGIGFLDRIHIPGTMRGDVLPRIAFQTGGQVDPEFRQKGIETSFAKITEEVRTQYTVGYYSKLPALNDQFRKLEVRVLKPNLTVIAKDGYYPTPTRSTPVQAPASAAP